MSSSSSDAEEDARLKAAVVTVSDIFAGGKVLQEAKSAPQSGDSTHVHPRDSRYDLDPECKKFLASKLDEILEKTYKFTKRKPERAEEPSPSAEASGIRLFSNSELLSEVPKFETDSKRMKKRQKKTDIIPRLSATDEMLKSCAVSADWLLNENPLRKAR